MRCPICGQNIEDNWFCPFCGYEISNNDSENTTEINNVIDKDENEINEQNTFSQEEYVTINNNPFSFSGRITRFPYFLILLDLWIFLKIFDYIKHLFIRTLDDSAYQLLYVSSFVVIIIVIITFFAVIKRLRDIKWNPWFCLIIFVPNVNYIFGLILLFMKSKYQDTQN